MSKPKLTPWFPPSVNPAHAGVYEMECDTPWFRQWDGFLWHCGDDTVDLAASESKPAMNAGIAVRWRGLAQEPKA